MNWAALLTAVSGTSLIAWVYLRPRRARHARQPSQRDSSGPLDALIDATWEPRPAGQRATLSCGCVVWYLPYGEGSVTKCRHHAYMDNPDFAAWTVEMGRRARDRRG